MFQNSEYRTNKTSSNHDRSMVKTMFVIRWGILLKEMWVFSPQQKSRGSTSTNDCLSKFSHKGITMRSFNEKPICTS